MNVAKIISDQDLLLRHFFEITKTKLLIAKQKSPLILVVTENLKQLNYLGKIIDTYFDCSSQISILVLHVQHDLLDAFSHCTDPKEQIETQCQIYLKQIYSQINPNKSNSLTIHLTTLEEFLSDKDNRIRYWKLLMSKTLSPVQAFLNYFVKSECSTQQDATQQGDNKHASEHGNEHKSKDQIKNKSCNNINKTTDENVNVNVNANVGQDVDNKNCQEDQDGSLLLGHLGFSTDAFPMIKNVKRLPDRKRAIFFDYALSPKGEDSNLIIDNPTQFVSALLLGHHDHGNQGQLPRSTKC